MQVELRFEIPDWLFLPSDLWLQEIICWYSTTVNMFLNTTEASLPPVPAISANPFHRHTVVWILVANLILDLLNPACFKNWCVNILMLRWRHRCETTEEDVNKVTLKQRPNLWWWTYGTTCNAKHTQTQLQLPWCSAYLHTLLWQGVLWNGGVKEMRRREHKLQERQRGNKPALPPPKTSAACLFPSRTVPSSCPPPDRERPLPPSKLLSMLSAPSLASLAPPPAPPWSGEAPASQASAASCPAENVQFSDFLWFQNLQNFGWDSSVCTTYTYFFFHHNNTDLTVEKIKHFNVYAYLFIKFIL